MLSSVTPEHSVAQPHEKLIERIEAQTPVRIRESRTYMQFLNESLEAIYPGQYTGTEYDEVLVESFAKTTALVANFAEIVEVVAMYDDEAVLKELFQGFKELLEHYDKPIGYSGRDSSADEDFYKFIGDELFATMTSILLREQKWRLIKQLLEYRVIVANAHSNQAEIVDYKFIGCASLGSFAARNQRLKRLSARADILSERHNTPPISDHSSLDDYVGADFFLYLYSKRNGDGGWMEWIPWSALYIKELPKFLMAAESKKVAQELMAMLHFDNVDELKVIVVRCAAELKRMWQGGWWLNPIDEKSMQSIGRYP